MEFPGPDAADLAQVEALNQAFLRHLAAAGRSLADSLGAGLGERLARSGDATHRRLARCPFLLFSLGEDDASLWAPLFAGKVEPDLVDALDLPTPGEVRIVTAGLAFLWQCAVHNAYSARFVSGDRHGWCERLADCALADVIEFAMRKPGLLQLRRAGDREFWRRLLETGTCGDGELRRAARISALQSLLTFPGTRGGNRLASAACAMPDAARQVADRSSVSNTDRRRYNTPPHESSLDQPARKDLPER